jgi:hypothetical protein
MWPHEPSTRLDHGPPHFYVIGADFSACLSTCRVPYATWIRFILPLWLALLALSAIAAAVAVWIGY